MAREVVNYVLDACAMLAYFQDEEGSEKVVTLMEDTYNRFFIHAITVGEIYYNALRQKAKDSDRIWDDLQQLPVTIIWELDRAFIERVGKYKTSFKLSYADCFVLALAEQKFAAVITTDHHELEAVEKAGKISFCWLR